MAENASPPNLQRKLDRQHRRYVEKHERARGIVKAKPAIGLVVTHHKRAKPPTKRERLANIAWMKRVGCYFEGHKPSKRGAGPRLQRIPVLRSKRLPRAGTVIDHVIFGLGVVKERAKGQIRVSFRKHGEKVFQEAFMSVDKFTIKPTRKASK